MRVCGCICVEIDLACQGLILLKVGLVCSTNFVQMESEVKHFDYPKGNQCNDNDGDDFSEVHWL